ncbi:MAG: non-canonical purine NTP pyrophosphatase, partial [Armatimonadota bacterium]
MPRRIVVATRNAGKMREIRALLAEIPTQLLSLEDLAEPIQLDEPFDSFWANARHKASKVAAATGEWGLADDSGLEVDALDGWPGVRSARSAGRCAGDADRVAVLLQRLGDVPAESRTARFVCVIALASPSGEVWQWRGTCEGVIA